jgi:tagatose 6-phosphate kinase
MQTKHFLLYNEFEKMKEADFMIHLICPNPAVDRTLLLETIENAIPNRPIEVKEFPGGKSFNVAYALTYEKISETVMIHTMIGGLYGKQLVELAQAKGYLLRTTAVQKNTRLCNILVDVQKKEIVPVYEKGFELDEATLALFTQNLIHAIHENDIVVFSGSLMKGMPADYISQLEAELARRQVTFKLCVDTSGAALKETYQKAAPYLIKINDEEVREIFPKKQLNTVEDYLTLLADGIKKEIPNFIITLGKAGIVARMHGEFYFGAAQPVEAKNPIACGDFFLGRLIKGIAEEDSVEAMLKSALVFSTCNVLNWYPEVTDTQLATILPTITLEKKTFK